MGLLRQRATIYLPVLYTLIAVSLAACTSPLDLDTPIRKTLVDLDSIVSSDDFTGAPGDSIFATVSGERIIFATEVLRPSFYNAVIDGAHYVTIQATRYGLNGRDYEAMSIRMDAVRDTGTYPVNAPFSAPKQIDPTIGRRFGALYERRMNGGFPESYRTGDESTSGTIRVVRIDTARGVMVGTFTFTGYSIERDSTIKIEQGAFRLQLKK
jgi:hypothetical protein